MKNTYQFFTKSFAVLAFMVLPIVFYGQETEKESDTKAKTSSFAPYWFLHGDLGITDYHGSVAKYKFKPDFSQINIGGNLSFGRQLCPFCSAEAEFFRGFLTGEKEEYNQYFKADVFETSLLGQINLFNLIGGYAERKFSIDAIVGIGAMQYWSKLYNLTTDAEILVLGRENSPEAWKKDHIGLWDRRLVGVLPVGLGFNFGVSENVDLNLDWKYKFVDTKMLDGNSIQPGSVDRDMYQYLGLGATFKFGQGGNLKSMKKDYELVTLKATPEVLKERGDTVEVTVEGTFPPKYFSKKAAMLIQPVLKYDGGEIALEPYTLRGEDVIGEGKVISNKNGGSFKYTQKFEYTPEMNKSDLVVNPIAYIAKENVYPGKDEIVANTKYLYLGERKLADGVIYTSERIYPGDANMIAAHHGYEKEVIITEKAKIFFKVNRYNLNWNLPLNKKECSVEAIDNMWAFINKNWKIRDIQIDGWASPEGEETFNENLSENRAKTAFNYMTRKLKRMSWKKDAIIDYKNPEEQIDFIIKNHGPDWTGFMNKVEKSDIEDKNVILNVIRSAGSQLKKEQEIRNMILIYPEIEENILKPLRRAEMAVSCYEPKRTDENIAELATTYPDSLEIEELLFAATMTDDKGTRLMIFESVIEIYPDDWKAYNNAAVCKIKDGKYQEAAALLKDAIEIDPNNATIYNNMGVLALHTKDYSHAEQMFKKAQSLGQNENYNLGLIEIEKGEYGKAMQLFGGKSCDYNLGLAQIAAEDYTKAEKTLKCTEDNIGETYYLLAVVGARTENSSMMYEYLTKAIKENPELKAQAKTDREFLNYENEPDFQALVD